MRIDLNRITDSPERTASRVEEVARSMADTLRTAGVEPARYHEFIGPLVMFKYMCDMDVKYQEFMRDICDQDIYDRYQEEFIDHNIPAGCSFEEQLSVSTDLGSSLQAALVKIEDRNTKFANFLSSPNFADLDDITVRDLYASLVPLNLTKVKSSDDAFMILYSTLVQVSNSDAERPA